MTIVYKKEIIETYRDIPIMEIDQIPFGAIINRTPGDLGFGFNKFAITANIPPIRGIIPWQRHYFPDSPYIYSSHTLINMFSGRYFEVTNPRARYGLLTDDNLDPAKVYTICMYQDGEVTTAEGRRSFYDLFNLLNKTNYDYLQLINILILSFLGWDEADYFPFADMGKDRKVCSVAAAVCWINYYYKFLKDTPARRPCGEYNAERVPPCLFESPMYNNGTFKIIGRLRSGLLD